MYKYASTSSGLLVAEIAGPASIRKAAALALGVPQQHIYKEGHRVNFKDVPKREGYLYVHNRAISSRANDNWDEWPAEEIATTEPGYGYLTFVGKPVFVEHANDNHRRTRGVNIAAALHEDTYPDGTPDTWVQVYKEIDPKAYPKLAKALLTGRINKTSMGADVGFSQCSKCGNLATTPAEYCQHIPNAKGARFEKLNIKTGRKEPRIVTEICRKVSFFEDTFIVTTPADPTAFILGVDDGSQKTAAVQRREHIRVQADAPYQGGHTFHLFPSGTKELYEHVMEAHDPHGRVRGHIKWDDQNGEVIHIETHPEERRNGLATELMRQATRASRLRGYPVPGPSAYRTEDGDRFAESFGKPMPERIPVKDDTRAMARLRVQAFKEITLPPRVDTLSHTVCPTCGSENSFTGDRCSVCNGIKPPDNFMEPDTSIAPQVQELLDDDGPGVDAEGIDMHTDPDLVCPECGESFTSAEQDEEKGNPFLVGAEQQMEEDPEMSEEGVPDEDDEEEDGNPFASKDNNSPSKTKSKAGPDGESSVPLGEDDEMTQAQDNPEYDEASEADEPVTEEPGNMEKDTEINPEVEDGQPDADADMDPNAQGEESEDEEMEEAAQGEASSEMTGYNPGDICPACGQGELIPAAELEADFPGADEAGEEKASPFAKGGDEVNDEGEEDAEDEAPFNGDGAPEEDEDDTDEDESGQEEDEDDEGDDEDPPVKPKSRHEGAQVMPNKPTGRTTPKGTQPNPAAEQRRTLINALNAQASLIEKLSGQMDLLLRERVENRKAMKRMASVIQSHELSTQASAVRNEALERQMYFVSKAAGLDDGVVEIGKAAYAKVAAMYKRANPANPAQPIAEPAGEAPVATEGEAQQPTARDDVTQLGATPLTDVSADASIPVDQPYGEYANRPVGENRVDVTAPVEGTQYQRPPSETIIPVDVRVGNPDNPNQAFPWTMGPVGGQSTPTPPGPSVGNPPTAQNEVTTAKGASRTYATLRLAKLQIAAGIASGDELEIAASLDSSNVSDEAIKTQIETLAKVVEHQGRMVQASAPRNLAPAPAPGRRLVPKAASAEVRSPSLNPSMSNPEAPHGVSAGPIMEDEIGFF